MTGEKKGAFFEPPGRGVQKRLLDDLRGLKTLFEAIDPRVAFCVDCFCDQTSQPGEEQTTKSDLYDQENLLQAFASHQPAKKDRCNQCNSRYVHHVYLLEGGTHESLSGNVSRRGGGN